MVDCITYVGLDVHKDSIVVAVAAGGLRGEVREYGRIANTSAALDRLLRKLGGDGMTLRFCYEAGPCGYGIQRRLSTGGHECVVVAPSLIPKRAGDRVKTDRRDAASLAKLHRAGEPAASPTGCQSDCRLSVRCSVISMYCRLAVPMRQPQASAGRARSRSPPRRTLQSPVSGGRNGCKMRA